MNDAFMSRLAPHVSGLLPVRAGESFDDYCARVRLEPVYGCRVLIAAAVTFVVDELTAERQVHKNVWIGAARLAFDAGDRQSCAICGRYEGITQAHHTVPLALQFDAGAAQPDQDFAWLCPTHHVAAHVRIVELVETRARFDIGLPDGEEDILSRFLTRFVDRYTKLPYWGKRR